MTKRYQLLIFLFIVISFLFLEIPLFAKKIRPNARLKACQSNMRVINGALEMYQLDTNVIKEPYLPGGDFEKIENILIEGKYIKNHIEGPEDDCSYGFVISDKDELVMFCKRHGTLETKEENIPILPKYNVSDEKPFSKAYYSRKAAKKRKRLFNYILDNYLLSPISFVIYIFLIIFLSSSTKKVKKQDN